MTIVFTTSRYSPCFEWFIDSLAGQMPDGTCIDVVKVNSFAETESCYNLNSEFVRRKVSVNIHETPVKPNVWQGKHRLAQCDHWAAAASRNTGLCLTQTGYVVFLDDRSVLQPGWLAGLQRAAREGYAVCGTYEKRHNMRVDNGKIVDLGKLDGKDARTDKTIRPANGQFWGGTLGVPTEWALKVNGLDEGCDGLGAEDYIFGMMLQNAGCRVMFDPSIAIIQDRTPSESGPVMKKTDKGVSPNDKSHSALERFGRLSRASHPWNLAEIRGRVLAGYDWPSIDKSPTTDWFDQQPVSEFK